MGEVPFSQRKGFLAREMDDVGSTKVEATTLI